MEQSLSQKIIHAATEVHRHLGPGLLENIYESALCHELNLSGLACQRQIPIPVIYKGIPVRGPLFLDLLVENQIIVEIKATEKDYPYHHVQLFTHLRLLKVKSGLLINFGKAYLPDGVSKIINDS